MINTDPYVWNMVSTSVRKEWLKRAGVVNRPSSVYKKWNELEVGVQTALRLAPGMGSLNLQLKNPLQSVKHDSSGKIVWNKLSLNDRKAILWEGGLRNHQALTVAAKLRGEQMGPELVRIAVKGIKALKIARKNPYGKKDQGASAKTQDWQSGNIDRSFFGGGVTKNWTEKESFRDHADAIHYAKTISRTAKINKKDIVVFRDSQNGRSTVYIHNSAIKPK